MVPYRELKKRIDRDRARKAEKRKQIRLEDVFTPRHYVKCLKKCRKGVSFKLSVQKYTAKPLEIMMRSWKASWAATPICRRSIRQTMPYRMMTRA